MPDPTVTDLAREVAGGDLLACVPLLDRLLETGCPRAHHLLSDIARLWADTRDRPAGGRGDSAVRVAHGRFRRRVLALFFAELCPDPLPATLAHLAALVRTAAAPPAGPAVVTLEVPEPPDGIDLIDPRPPLPGGGP